MAGGDAVVLQRLMTLLTAPLSRLDSPGQVGIQAPFAEGPVSFMCTITVNCLALAHIMAANQRHSRGVLLFESQAHCFTMPQSISQHDTASQCCIQRHAFKACNKQGCCLAQDVYAEWVGAEAKLALLEAHAQCRACVAGLPDEATHTSVVNAQEPHARLAGCCKIHTIASCAQG